MARRNFRDDGGDTGDEDVNVHAQLMMKSRQWQVALTSDGGRATDG